MFTGLIEEVGTVVAVRARDDGTELQIAAPGTAKHVSPGESIAVNGCCLTLTSCRSDCLSFDLLEETIARTNLNDLRQNSPVNLERALRADGRLGGHFVQGHIDYVSPIIALRQERRRFPTGSRIAGELRRIMSLPKVRSQSTESVLPLRKFFGRASLPGSFLTPDVIRILIVQKPAISSISSSTFSPNTSRECLLRHVTTK